MELVNPLNVLKIVTTIITCALALVAGFIEIRKNPKYWLNRWFALYFSAISIGFLVYSIYHLIIVESLIPLVIPLMITAQILYHVGMVSLLMTTFILDYSEKVAMDKKYLLIILALLIISSFGYFVWYPELNMENFAKGVVDTETPLFWYLFVSLFRVSISAYVLYKFSRILQKLDGMERKRILWFFIGSAINIGGILINMIGGIVSLLILEILGLATFNIGTFFIVRGFLLKKQDIK